MVAGIFKNIGLGIGYFFFFPFALVAIALYAVFGLLVFIFQFFKLIFLFFTGRTLFSDLNEDVQLKALNTPDQPDEKAEEQAPAAQSPSTSPMYGSGYVSPIFSSQEEQRPTETPSQPQSIHIEVPPTSEPEVESQIEQEPGQIHIDIGSTYDEGGDK